jgi:hypothetical protein
MGSGIRTPSLIGGDALIERYAARGALKDALHLIG